MSKKSKKSNQGHGARGRYQIIHPATGMPMVAALRKDAVEAACLVGTHFFYEMDDKGPFFESPIWVWMLEVDPDNEDVVIATQHSLAELERAHGLAMCS